MLGFTGLQQEPTVRASKITRKSTAKINGFDEEDYFVPSSAYGSLCPLEHMCNVPVNQLPTACTKSVIFQSAFGNPGDVALMMRQAEDTNSAGVMDDGVMLGYPSLEERGWEYVEEPRAVRILSTNDEREFLSRACECFGMSYVHKQGEESDRFAVSYAKAHVPGSCSDIVDRVKKLQGLEHVNVIRFIEACEDQSYFHLIFESLDGAGYLPLRVNGHGNLPPNDVAKLCQQMAAGLAAGFRKGLNLLDWSVWNILSTNYYNLLPIKVFGLGLVGVFHNGGSGQSSWAQRAPYYYMAPEICRPLLPSGLCDEPYKRIDQSSRAPIDMWGLGVIAFMCASGHPPVTGADTPSILANITLLKSAPVQNGFERFDQMACNLIQGLLSSVPKSRPKPEDVICNSWVVKLSRSPEDKDNVLDAICRMRVFAGLSTGMRAIGKVMVQNLRQEKLDKLEGLFHALDVRGDGELAPQEIGVYMDMDEQRELREMFKLLDLRDRTGMTLSEFVLSNMFGGDMLTERMLLRTFEYLDLDGTGDITATELYSALIKYKPDLQPEHISDIMRGNAKDGKEDWEADIDMERFRSFFPSVRSHKVLCEQRLEKNANSQKVAEEIVQTLDSEAQQWCAEIQKDMKEAMRVRQAAVLDVSEEKVDNPAWMKDLVKILKKMLCNVQSHPKVEIPNNSHTEELAAEEARAQKKHSKMCKKMTKSTGKTPPADPGIIGGAGIGGIVNPNAGTEAHGHSGLPEFEWGGIMHADCFFTKHRGSWIKEVGKLTADAKSAAVTKSQNRKRQDSITALDDLEVFVRDLLEDCTAAMSEQLALLETSRNEAALPSLPYSRRGLISSVEENSENATTVEKYLQEMQNRLAQEVRRESQRDEMMKSLTRTHTEGEQRGLEWLERQIVKSKKTGKPLPAAARALTGINPEAN